MATLTEQEYQKLSTESIEEYNARIASSYTLSTDSGAKTVEDAKDRADKLSGPTAVTSAEQFQKYTGVAPSPKQLEQINSGALKYNPSTKQVESAAAPSGTPTVGAAPTVGEDNRTDEEKKIDQIITHGGVIEEVDGKQVLRTELTDQEKLAVREKRLDIQLEEAKSRITNFGSGLSSDPQLKEVQRVAGALWESRIRDMKQANRSRLAAFTQLGFRLGGQQTSAAVFGMSGEQLGTEFGTGILGAEELAGLNRIDDLEAKKQAAIAEATTAYRKEKWDQYVELVDIAEKEYENQVEAIKALNKTAQEENKKVKDQEVLSKKQAAIYNSLVGGATDKAEIFASLKNEGFEDLTLKEVDEAFAVLAESFGLTKPETPEEKESMATKLTGDAKNFFLLKENYPASLPGFIKELPEEEQLGAYMKWVETTSGKSKAGGAAPTSLDFGSMIVRVARTAFGSGRALSDADRDFAKGLVEAGLREGKSEYEIIDAVTGFNITRNLPLGNKLRQIIYQAAGSGRGIQEINLVPLSRAINEGDEAKAITITEDIAYDQSRVADPVNFISENIVRQQTNLVNELTKLMDDEGLSNVVGTFSGTFNELLTKYLRGKDATEVRNRAIELVTQMLEETAGVNITKSERAFLEPRIPTIGERVPSFMVKLRNLKTLPLSRLNSMRNERNMPTLDEKSLLNRDLRVPLYVGEVASDNMFSEDELGEIDSALNEESGADAFY